MASAYGFGRTSIGTWLPVVGHPRIHAMWIAVAVDVVAIAVFGAMFWLLLDIRSRVEQLELRVASIEVAAPGPATGELG